MGRKELGDSSKERNVEHLLFVKHNVSKMNT